MSKSWQLLCSGAGPSASSAGSKGKVEHLDALGPDPNVNLRLENITDAFLREPPPRIIDLLEIAAYVHAADCIARRDGRWQDDHSTEPWSRDFHFVMPVRDLAFWDRHDVRQLLATSLNYLSGDTFDFSFQQLTKARPWQNYLDIEDVQESVHYKVDRVIMFSGGLDSLAGAVESAVRGESLVLVSHRPAAQINKRQLALVQKLRELYGVKILHLPVWVNKEANSRESTQRARSFLFAALGTAAASILNAGGVRFYENGVISLNWPVADEVLGSRASRTTHPQTLLNLQALLQLVTDRDSFQIDNPFVFKTKTDIVKIIADNGGAALIDDTCSCAHTMFQPKDQWHCGRCGQCIDRRIAILAAGLEQHDSSYSYEQDVFTGARELNPNRPYDHNIAAGYVRFAQDIKSLSATDEVEIRYQAELSAAARCFPNASATAELFVAMHTRHAAAVMGVLTKQVEVHAAEFAAGRIPPSSLLGMLSPARREDETNAEPVQPARNGAVFRKAGDYWRVVYSGQNTMLQDTVGVRHIARLLESPDTPFLAYHLVLLEKGSLPQLDEALPTMTADELAEEGLPSIGIPEESLEKARSTVTHAIIAVLNKLKKQHPALHDHLRASLTLGLQVSYRPNNSTSWNL